MFQFAEIPTAQSHDFPAFSSIQLNMKVVLGEDVLQHRRMYGYPEVAYGGLIDNCVSQPSSQGLQHMSDCTS